MKKNLFRLLAISLLSFTLFSCGDPGDYRIVKFNANTTYETNNVLPQSVKVGGKIKKPSVQILEENPENYKVYAWYRDKNLTKEWNFKKDTVQDNMTLYASWKRVFTVNYYLGNDSEPVNTIDVFEGDTVKEHPDYAIGFDYLGSYLDKEYTQTFDYSTGITSNTNIYMKKSDGISLYEGNPAGGLYDNLEIFQPTDNASTPLVPEIGTISRNHEKDAVLIDFGYAPDIGDGYCELSLNLDISKSQVLHFVMKHYGLGDSLTLYFTTLLDVEQFNYSATGKNYNENFVARYNFAPNEIGMTDDDEYIDVAIDLAANSMFNGYSVWGTSAYLAKIRIQPTYTSTSPEDNSNKMLLKRIYGTNEGYENGVEVKDSPEISALLSDETPSTQHPQPKGFIFPKDSYYADESEDVMTYQRKDGILLYFKNEIEMRSRTNKTQSISFTLPVDQNGDVIGDKVVSLDDNKVLYLTLQNYGYASNLRVIVTNDYEGKTYTTIKLDQRMYQNKTYSINLSKEALMIHTLLSITIEYEAVGVDNAVLLSEVYFDETKPYDIAGVSFDDKNMFGLVSSDHKVELSYNPSYYSTEFDVKSNNAVVESSRDNIKLTNMGYYGLNLNFTKTKDSMVNAVYISLYVNGGYSQEYKIVTLESGSASCSVRKEDMGIITNIKFRFEGTGIIRISTLRFVIDNERGFDLGKDLTNGVLSDWHTGMSYGYNEVHESSTFTSDPTQTYSSYSFYLGIGHQWYGDLINCKNLKLAGCSQFVLVYNNPNDVGSMEVVPTYSRTESGNPDGETTFSTEVYNINLECNMKEYEWSYVTFNMPLEYQDAYCGKVIFRNIAKSVDIRLFAVI